MPRLKDAEREEIRNDLIAYVAERGQGAINEIAGKIGSTRQLVSGFRNGGRVGDAAVRKIGESVKKLRRAPDLSDIPRQFVVMAGEFRLLLDTLLDPTVSNAHKASKMLWLGNEIQSIESDLRKLKDKTTERSGKS